jgi:hypothetical protein
LAPLVIASQPPTCAGVGAAKASSNQRLTGALKGASGLAIAVGLCSALNPRILRTDVGA